MTHEANVSFRIVNLDATTSCLGCRNCRMGMVHRDGVPTGL